MQESNFIMDSAKSSHREWRISRAKWRNEIFSLVKIEPELSLPQGYGKCLTITYLTKMFVLKCTVPGNIGLCISGLTN